MFGTPDTIFEGQGQKLGRQFFFKYLFMICLKGSPETSNNDGNQLRLP